MKNELKRLSCGNNSFFNMCDFFHRIHRAPCEAPSSIFPQKQFLAAAWSSGFFWSRTERAQLLPRVSPDWRQDLVKTYLSENPSRVYHVGVLTVLVLNWARKPFSLPGRCRPALSIVIYCTWSYQPFVFLSFKGIFAF